MSRLYDTVEPSVIDDVTLKTAIEEQGPQEEAGVIARKDGITYDEVTNLRLDFKSTFTLFVAACRLLKHHAIFIYRHFTN
jgi:hypothetical protein